MIAFGVIAWRGLRVALLAPDPLALLSVEFAMMVALQAFVNMSVVTGLRPPKAFRCRHQRRRIVDDDESDRDGRC